MTGDSIRAFKGEVLWAPEALELSMNWCSHACSYCYANARKPNRAADFGATMGLLANFRQRKTPEAKLLQLGYPVNVSNHVDVFAGTNARQFEPIWEVMVDQGVPIVWQTRGAHKPQQKILDRVISETPRSVWYISIPMWDDAIRQRVEPQAPSIDSRLDLVRQLRDAGHSVVVGMNPTTLEWLPEFEPLLDFCQSTGVWGVWSSSLYFGRLFNERLTPDQIKRVTPELMARCGCNGSKIDHEHILQAMDYAEALGLATYYAKSDRPSRMFEAWFDVYPRVMPMLQELINAADSYYRSASIEDYIVIELADAVEAMRPLPAGFDYGPFFHSDVKQFRIDQGLGQGAKLPRLDVEGFWRQLWNSEFFSRKAGPLSISRFAYASVVDDGTLQPLLDGEGNRLIVYRPQGWPYLYANTPELA